MTADSYLRFRDTYVLDNAAHEELHPAFREAAARLARSMGYFNPAHGSPTHPATTNTLFGDRKHVRSMFRSARHRAGTSDHR